ncbi:hypothetical protein OKW22_000999 [Bacilli bacterium PM5-3]|nr:hypothetical protein [Bacilli bacterium PM5-3]MDH6604232.1 hypothetical protein [Bacilli bacterium PM5-9]
MGVVEAIDFDEVVDPEEELKGFYREINRLLQINSTNDYYIDEEVFGYGLEIEVSAQVKRTHFVFLTAMLNNIINVVNYRGNFVFDRTILGDYGFEICLDPLEKEECIRVYSKIREIIDFSGDILSVSSNFSCGLHINIKADERIKAEKFKQLFDIIDVDDKETFAFNEYKKIIDVDDYETYLSYQQEISGKYLAVNLLKPNLIELRCVNSEITMDKFADLLYKIENVFGKIGGNL